MIGVDETDIFIADLNISEIEREGTSVRGKGRSKCVMEMPKGRQVASTKQEATILQGLEDCLVTKHLVSRE